MKKAIAEFIGTFALVFIGCGTVVVGGMATGSTAITELAIAFAFGLSIVAMAYGIGQISGCHLNPAVSFGVYTAGRMSLKELLAYCMAQVAGAIAAALVLYLILSARLRGGMERWARPHGANIALFLLLFLRWWGLSFFSFASSVSLSAVHLWNWPVSRSD